MTFMTFAVVLLTNGTFNICVCGEVLFDFFSPVNGRNSGKIANNNENYYYCRARPGDKHLCVSNANILN